MTRKTAPPGRRHRAAGRFGQWQFNNDAFSYTDRLAPSNTRLCEPLHRLAWLRQELNLWNEAEGNRPMPQPRDFGLNLPNLRPSEIRWGAA